MFGSLCPNCGRASANAANTRGFSPRVKVWHAVLDIVMTMRIIIDGVVDLKRGSKCLKKNYLA